MTKRYTKNDFLARPKDFHGGVTGGIHTHPGFHTADSVETTYAYAQQKAVPDNLNDELAQYGPGNIPLPDYPVVVTLDMHGMNSHTDYDAVEIVRPHIYSVAQEVMEHGREDPVDMLRDMCEAGEQPEEHTWDYGVTQWLFSIGSAVVNDPICSLSEYVLSINDDKVGAKFIKALADGTISDDALKVITGQYRYVDDVSTDRIIAVDYVAPFFPHVFEWQLENKNEMELARVLDKHGWAIFDLDDGYSHSIPSVHTEVYKRRAPKNARIEYHGTTYRNLAQAAPELKLPHPPRPYKP